jgi:poly(3-hydroxybutyrate) depolymerase
MHFARSRSFTRLFVPIILITILVYPHPLLAQNNLPALKINSQHVYVAGISSGAAVAIQMDVAYSKVFKGAAIYAGIPYDCAQDSLETALTTCEQDTPAIDVSTLESATTTLAKSGGIDPTRNLKNQPIYLWSGMLDSIVAQGSMNNVDSYYKFFGANVFKYDNDFPAEHGWESPYGPNLCQQLGSPYVIVCDQNSDPYDSEQVFLSKWFGKLKPKNNGTLTGTLSTFNQDPYVPGGSASAISMDTTGYLFTPAACTSKHSCGLILALHGCEQSANAVGTAYVDDAGLNQWADTNQIVVMYPQAIPSTPNNGEGCWDWWGYTNSSYAQKTGPQMQTLFNMVKQVAGKSIPAGG